MSANTLSRRERRQLLLEKASVEAELARALLARIRREQPRDGELALLVADHTAIFAVGPAPKRGSPHSPVRTLVHGIYETQGPRARLLVRKRIFTTYEPSELCHGIIKVAARKIRQVEEEPEAKGMDLSAYSFLELKTETAPRTSNPEPRTILSPLALAFQLAESVPRTGPRFQSSRPIGAVLVAADGTILEACANSNGENRTLHAELNVLTSHYARTGKPVPAGARLYSTLKPCRMCAGAIWQTAANPNEIEVLYAEHDPGPNARVTLLDAHSPERLRAARGDSSLVRLQLERLVEKSGEKTTPGL